MKDSNKEENSNYLKAPFEALWKDSFYYFLWLLFLIVAGQLGTIINIINRCVFHGWRIENSLLADSVSGNFYLFSIVLVSSVLGSLVINYIGRKNHEHKRATVMAIVLSFLFCIINAVFFSSATQDYAAEFETIDKSSITVDYWQSAFYILSILVATYLFGLERIHGHREYDRLEAYGKNEKSNIKRIQKGAGINKEEDIAL